MTYNGTRSYTDKSSTYGGYSTDIVVDEHFVLRIPSNLDLAGAAPLLCAGITMYSPMKHWKMDRPGSKVAVVGLGGLGHMAVKFGVAFGCEVTVISHSNAKEALARKMGAKELVHIGDEAILKKREGYFDFILDTTSQGGSYDKLISLLATNGTVVQVGVSQSPVELNTMMMIKNRRQFAGSLIGGIKQTQEMLDFCGKHNITCDIEKINADYVPEAYKRVVNSDVRFRFVIDCSSLNKKA